MDWTAVWLTLQLAAATSAVLLLAGVPTAYWLANARFRGKFMVEAVVALPIVLPPTVLGFYLLTVMGKHSPLGQMAVALTGATWNFTFVGILIGSVLFNLPFAIRPFTAAFEAVDRRHMEASWCLGVSSWTTFWRVTLPLAKPGIVAGVLLTFAHTIGEFGVVLMVGGNIPGTTRTLSVALYDDVQAGDYHAANTTALALLVFAFLVLCIVQRAGKRLLP